MMRRPHNLNCVVLTACFDREQARNGVEHRARAEQQPPRASVNSSFADTTLLNDCYLLMHRPI